MKQDNLIDAWTLYRMMFQEGDEVVVVNTDGNLYWGEAHSSMNHLTLKRSGQKAIKLDWDDVRFMAHDGFPASKLLGADGSDTIEDIDTADLQKSVRSTLQQITKIEQFGKVKPTPIRHVRFGDPFVIENVSGYIANTGPENVFEWGKNHNWIYEETVLLQAKDGARGMLWHLPSCYFFEADR